MISIAPRFAEMNAKPVTHAGNARPDRKKSRLVETARRAKYPIPSTKTKYNANNAKSTALASSS